MTSFKKGDIVLYSPSDLPGTPQFGAVVASEPRVIGGTLLCRLEGLDKTYKRGQTIVPEAVVDRLVLAPTVYCVGQEHTPDGWHRKEHVFEDEYDGEIAYDAGEWLWWAMGIPGKSNSYEAARAAVEELQMIGWYYLNTNMDLLWMPGAEAAADIRDDSTARGMWPFDPEDRRSAWRICVEALAGGAKRERVIQLARWWKCDESTAQSYAASLGCKLALDGDQWCATGPGFRDLQLDEAGFGGTPVEAFADLALRVGYRPSTLWGETFKDRLAAVGCLS